MTPAVTPPGRKEGGVMERLLGLAVALCVAVSMHPAGAAPDANAFTWRQTWFPSKDGTMLRADVMLPASRRSGQRHPVILSAGPYFGRNNSNQERVRTDVGQPGPVLRFADLMNEGRIFARGYAFVQVDTRGYGGSGGCSDLGGPGERSDVKAAVEWAARQAWSTGKVGMWGKSYDGFTQVMALAERPRGLAAAVIQSPLIETYRGLHMNEVPYSWYTSTPAIYAALDLEPVIAIDAETDEYVYPARGSAEDADCYADNLAWAPIPDRDLPYWRARNIVDAAAKSSVPTLWSIGLNDVNTKADNFLPVYSRLRGPKRAWVGQYNHVRGNEAKAVGRRGFMREAMAWLDRYVKGVAAPAFAPIEVQSNEGWWRTEEEWPPRDVSSWSVTLNGGTYADASDGTWATGDRPLDTGILTFSHPAPYDVHVAGTPVVNVVAQPLLPRATMVVALYDVAPDGNAKLITRGARLLRTAGAASMTLYPQDWILRRGHRLGVSVRASDDLYITTATGGRVTVTSGSVRLPALRVNRSANLDGGPAEAMTWVPTVQFSQSEIAGASRATKFPSRQVRA